MQLGDFPASHTHTHTHDIAISFGFEKTIMKFNKLGMSSARLENVLVAAPLQDCLQEMFFILALLTIVNQFRELSQSILEFDTRECLVS